VIGWSILDADHPTNLVSFACRFTVVVTDGYVDVEAETFDLIRENLGRASLYAFGIGSSVNRFLIEGMAHAGQGEPFIVTRPEEAAARADAFRRYIEAPVLTGIRLDFEGMDAYDVGPLSVPDVLASRPVVVFGKWRGERRGSLRLRGTGGEGPYERRFDLATIGASHENAALRYLWARSRIARLGDDEGVRSDHDRVAEITHLGLKYSLLTAYTSFVAVDQVVRNASMGDRRGEAQTVRQPLPMPAGVSNPAVGGQVPTTPEPEITALMAVAAAMAAWQRRRSKRHAS
jgi:Ca-activated chloride channel family protein